MFEILVTIAFIWLFVKVIGLTFKVTWGLAKIVAVILFVIALPTLIGCFLLAGGLALLIPIALVGAAFAILKACI